MQKIIAFLDPPYGVDVVNNDGKIGRAVLVKQGVYKKVKGDETTETAEVVYGLLNKMGIDRMIIWGGNYFTKFLPASPCWIIWDKKGEMESNNFADCEIAWTTFNTPSRIIKCIWRGMIKEGEHDKRSHPTQKPIKLLVEMLEKFTNPDDIVLDLFGGSGSLLVACEKAKRTCYMQESEAQYIDVIIKRYHKLYPDKPIECLTNKNFNFNKLYEEQNGEAKI